MESTAPSRDSANQWAQRLRPRIGAELLYVPLLVGLAVVVPLALVIEKPHPTWLIVLAWLVFGLALVAVVYSVRAMINFRRLTLRGGSYLDAGEAARAGELFDRSVSCGFGKAMRAVGAMNVAMARFHLGELDDAVAILRAVDESGGLRRVALYHCALPDLVAACHALLGRTEEAKEQLAEGKRRRGDKTPTYALVAEAVTLCRTGGYGRASEQLYLRLDELKAAGGRWAKMLRLVWAFSLQKDDPRNNRSAVELTLASAKPLAPGDLDALVVGWPEMRDFLATQRLLAMA